MRKFKEKIRALENFKSLHDYLPKDHSNTQSLDSYVQQLCSNLPDSAHVLDLGCGEGDSVELFKHMAPNALWHGVDIDDSPEVLKRTREHASIISFDGTNLPYPDNHFDLIYCNQVLEHVRSPDKLIAEALRVLKPKGVFAGSVSYLEPYHSYSIFNFTPFGVVRVIKDAGLELVEIRPGADASSLIIRQLLNRSNMFRLIWNRNYLHFLSGLLGFFARLGHCERNFLKIQFSGHLIFLAKRPGP